MKLELLRYTSDDDSSGGLLLVDNKFFCYTCEDEKREIKVEGETRIPNGNYEIDLRNEGGMTKRYSKKYPFHKGMLWIRNVMGFKYIYIHPGNNDDHTDGCILVGYTANRRNKENTVSKSTDAYTDLYKLIISAIGRDEDISISIWEM